MSATSYKQQSRVRERLDPEVRKRLEELVVGIAPAPVLARLEAADDGVAGAVVVLRRVAVGRVVATAHVSADETQAKMDPCGARGETLLAADGGFRLLRVQVVEVLAQLFCHVVTPRHRCWGRGSPSS